MARRQNPRIAESEKSNLAEEADLIVAGTKHHAVRVVLEMILDGFEERLGLCLVCLEPEGRLRLTGPVDHPTPNRRPQP
jgi:hypothetical protein